MLPQDIDAMIQGMDRGRTAFQGVMPSANNMGGAPAAMDLAAPMFDNCYQDVSALIDYLHQNREQQDADKLLSALKTISSVMQDRKRRFADQAVSGSGGAQPDIHAMGIVK